MSRPFDVFKFLFLNVRCDVSEVEFVAASLLERKPLLVIVSRGGVQLHLGVCTAGLRPLGLVEVKSCRHVGTESTSI